MYLEQQMQRTGYAVKLAGGETVYVDRLSVYFRQMMLDDTRRVYPDPDPKLYEKPMANAFAEGAMMPAEENDVYKRLKLEARSKQTSLLNRRILQAAVVDAEGGRDALLERYGGLLEQRRRLAELPGDDWQALVLAVLVTTDEDVDAILKAAINDVKEEDVQRAIQSFQLSVWWN